MSLTIEQLQLAPNAKRAAMAIKTQFPNAPFTSGRRDPRGQALAMAKNVVKQRDWILKTYKDTRMRNQLQEYVVQTYKPFEASPTVVQLANGLYGVMLAMSSGDLMKLSRHLTGDAFDISWTTDAESEAICQAIEALPASYWLDKILRREGQLKIIHAQFLPSVEV